MTTNSIAIRPLRLQRWLLFGILIIAALVAFETFNYSTTDFALSDLLGDLRFLGVRWATILAVAFCVIDFAGIARLFTPEQGSNEPKEVWYLFGAWLLAATMNAMLTWWGVSIAILNHETLGSALVERGTLLKVVPVFVAIMVWLIRVLIIGMLSASGERFFQHEKTRVIAKQKQGVRPVRSLGKLQPSSQQASASKQKSKNPKASRHSRPEPKYQPLARSARAAENSRQRRF